MIMKDFITSIAAVLVLMMFVMQFASNQAAFTKMMGAQYAVKELCLISENQGMIKSESIAELKTKLAERLGCSTAEVEVNLYGLGADCANTDDEPVSIELDVEMPVYGVIGPAGILGIDPAQNVRRHKATGLVVLEPETEPESPEPETEPYAPPEELSVQ
jgi:hypothetical protein